MLSPALDNTNVTLQMLSDNLIGVNLNTNPIAFLFVAKHKKSKSGVTW